VGAFEVDPLPRATISSLKLLLPLFEAMLSSSSLEESSGQAIIRGEVQMAEFLFGSSTTFERSIRGDFGLSFSK